MALGPSWRTVATMSDTAPEGFRQHRYRAPADATTILLVRHGESAPAHPDRPFPLVDGHGDPPLHDNGHQQARALADRLVHEPIDAIYVTTLQRTHQTAAPLAAALGIEPVVEPELREVFLGSLEGGGLRVAAAAGDPVVRRVYTEQRWDVIPGAEPDLAFEARTVGAVRRLADAHRGQRIVAVVHGGVIGRVLASATASSGFAFAGADNASISEIVVESGRIVVRRFNDTAHLDEA